MIAEYQNLTKEELITTIISFKAELDQLKRLIYGSKSERFVPVDNPTQTALGLDVEPVKEKPSIVQTIIYQRQKTSSSTTINSGRKPLPSHLERVRIVIEPTQDVTGLKAIGEEITEELELIPGKLFVNQFVRPKYAKADGEGILMGHLPSRPIEKGIPGPGLLSNILIEKYVDHLPCHRQIQRYERLGVSINASTMSDWISAGCTLIEPLYTVLKKEVLSSNYLQVDETPIKVLDKNKKGATHRGYYWVYYDPVKKIVLFDYRMGRGRDGPQEMLSDFEGHLQTDGYSVYEKFNNEKIKLLHCMAHARRKFEEALGNDNDRAAFVLSCMQKLYAVERICREENKDHEQRKDLRMQSALPVLNELHNWFKQEIIKVTPKSLIGEAIGYSLARWEKLMLYCTDGKLEIDNNPVENSIRPVALGRKNYLFAGSHNAAQRAAMIYSLLGTCKKNGIEPFEWMKNTLTKLPDHKANQLHTLLPR